jgi:hypothetical protein
MSYSINKGFIIQKMDDKTVMLDGDTSTLYTLNETADYIVKQIKKKASKQVIIQKMIKRYGVGKEKLTRDFDQVIKDLIKKKILITS